MLYPAELWARVSQTAIAGVARNLSNEVEMIGERAPAAA